ncbi:transcriptional corepressor LEUNIG-like, partial [Trifolium medium]|nr:transcriptional corepressor LEUNIG-like [Trifolium medium]
FQAGVSIVRFQPGSGMLLAVANQNVINILDFQTFIVQNCLRGHVKYICSLCWDVTGQTIASVSEDGLRVWSLSMGGQCLYHYPSKGKMFKSVIFHPRYRNVLVVGGFQCMELLILECNGQIHSIHSSSISITGLAACTQNEIFASTSNEFLPVVNIWK